MPAAWLSGHYVIGFAGQLRAAGTDGAEDDEFRAYSHALDPDRCPAIVSEAPIPLEVGLGLLDVRQAPNCHQLTLNR